jgi:hypothetical protein
MTGSQLATLAEELNGGASIGSTLLFQLINIAKALIEQERPWMRLRYTDTSKTVAASTNAWQTAIDLSTIARFNRFYGDSPIKLFDGSTKIEHYTEVPLNMRLQHRESPNTFVYDDAADDLYLNGGVSFAGTLYIDHIKDSPEIEDDDSSTWVFPSWSHSILAFMAVSMHKGGVDYDEVNARQLVQNSSDAMRIYRMLEKWDDEKQLAAQQNLDPSQHYTDGFRPGAINIGP